MPKMSKEMVKKIAQLCKLDLSEEDLERYAHLFSDTLENIDTLNELNTNNVTGTYQVIGLTNVFMQNGENTRTLSQKDALVNGKEIIRNLFATGAVFERS